MNAVTIQTTGGSRVALIRSPSKLNRSTGPVTPTADDDASMPKPLVMGSFAPNSIYVKPESFGGTVPADSNEHSNERFGSAVNLAPTKSHAVITSSPEGVGSAGEGNRARPSVAANSVVTSSPESPRPSPSPASRQKPTQKKSMIILESGNKVVENATEPPRIAGKMADTNKIEKNPKTEKIESQTRPSPSSTSPSPLISKISDLAESPLASVESLDKTKKKKKLAFFSKKAKVGSLSSLNAGSAPSLPKSTSSTSPLPK
jgi:hypothetical protein